MTLKLKFRPCRGPGPVLFGAVWLFLHFLPGTAGAALGGRTAGESPGLWAARGVTRAYFGGNEDMPFPADYDGDGTTDISIFRPAGGLWAVRGITRVYFGGETDRPVPSDYDGDGRSDIAIFRAGSGLWAVRAVTRVYFGASGDRPSPADFSGDRTTDIAIYRPGRGLWAVRGVTRVYFGGENDQPVSADYLGNGTADIAVFRPAVGLWSVRGGDRTYFGREGDWAWPASDPGRPETQPAIFRPSSGLWAVRGETRVYFGRDGDIPVPGDYDGDGGVEFAVSRGLRSPDDDGLVFAVFGDTHIGLAVEGEPVDYDDISREVVDLIRSFQPEITFHTGDAVENGCASGQWDEFFDIISHLHRTDDDFFLSIGNHDTGCAEEWLARFNFPGYRHFYSIRHRGIYFIVLRVPRLSNTAEYWPGSLQYSWLAEELQQAANDPETRFILVFMHVPLYACSETKGNTEGDPVLTPLFDEYNVDAVFSGHHHNYQRSKPIRSGAENPEGTTYVVTSGGGSHLREPRPRWYTETARREYHAIKGCAAGDYIEFEVYNIERQIIDSFILQSRR